MVGWDMINGSCPHLVFMKYSLIRTVGCSRGYLRLMQVYQLLGVNEQTITVFSWSSLLIGCACVFTWLQAGGPSVRWPPFINHVPAIADFSDLGAKPSLWRLPVMWLLTKLVKPPRAVRLLQEFGVAEWGGKGAAALTFFLKGGRIFEKFCYKDINILCTW